MNQQKNVSLNINPETLPDMTCTCGCRYFRPAMVIKKMSSIVSPTGRNEIVPLETMLCNECGKDLYVTMKERGDV